MSVIKVELDLADMFDENYGEESGDSLSEIIRENIISNATSQVRQQCQASLDNAIGDAVREITEKKVAGMVEEKLSIIVDSDEVKIKERYGDKEFTIDEMIVEYVHKSLNNSKLTSFIENKMKQHITDLKKNYDLAFAASVVNALHDQKMLNHDGLSALMNKNVE